MVVKPLTFIIQSAAVERVHYALMMAAANAALGGGVTLFFAIGTAEMLLPYEQRFGGEEDFLSKLNAANIAGGDNLLEALVELDCRIAVCDAALAFAELKASDLRTDLGIEVTGLTDILAKLDDGRIIYV